MARANTISLDDDDIAASTSFSGDFTAVGERAGGESTSSEQPWVWTTAQRWHQLPANTVIGSGTVKAWFSEEGVWKKVTYPVQSDNVDSGEPISHAVGH